MKRGPGVLTWLSLSQVVKSAVTQTNWPPPPRAPRRHPFDHYIHAPTEQLRAMNGSVAISLAKSTDARTGGLSNRTRLVLKHYPKAGCTEAIAALKLAMPSVRVIREAQSVSERDQSTAFVIGMVREPCSCYVSLWAFGSSRPHDGQFVRSFRSEYGAENFSRYYGHTPPFVNAADVAHFVSWMRMPANRGVITARFLAMYSSHPHVDCWITPADLLGSLHVCLMLFNQQGGSADLSRLKTVYTRENSSPHGPCSSYFDPQLAAEVVGGFDRSLYRAFGWDGCCATNCPACAVPPWDSKRLGAVSGAR